MSIMVSAFRFLIPPPEDRTPFTLSEARYFVLPAMLLVMLAGLARRPGTWLLRLALLPFALIAILRGVFGFAILDPDEEPVNQMFGTFLSVLHSQSA
jgi:disulfide bond formation protein DsbB